ncbi:MAG: hypothetical protein LBR53_07150 [Deltaproteobacteria bacterium]|nr:hypothetical protein [Deltaproteobacteria bacterium]
MSATSWAPPEELSGRPPPKAGSRIILLPAWSLSPASRKAPAKTFLFPWSYRRVAGHGSEALSAARGIAIDACFEGPRGGGVAGNDSPAPAPRGQGAVSASGGDILLPQPP